MTRDELRAALDNPNVRAFLAAIRAGEGTSDADGYRRMFGGELFTSYADHPRRAVTRGLAGQQLTSTAAGAYQFLSRTWDECVAALALPDFSAASQDLAAVFLINRRGALQDVLDGNIPAAIDKCNREWASLPGSPYGQPTRTMAQALSTYSRAGGRAAPQAAAPPPAAPQPKDEPMLPLIPLGIAFAQAALPALLEAAPVLTRIFGDGPRAEQNAKAVEAVAKIAMEATKQPTVEGAVQAIQRDPAQAAAFREGVHMSMGELLGHMVAAQKADDDSRDRALDRNLVLTRASGGKWLWLLGAVALIVVGMSYWITWGVLFTAGTTFTADTKAMLLGQVVILGFVTVLGFLYGSNIQNRIATQQKSDATQP